MCGIVGYCGDKNATKVLLDGLKALEYRGYDSAGVAYRIGDRVEVVKACGKILNLEKKLRKNGFSSVGIGHTRWATHGKPNELNSHPHRVGKFTIVHNGIVENYDALKRLLVKEGYKFRSETDSEVIAGLLDKLYSEKNDILKVLVQLKNLLIGSYALGIICDDIPDKIYAIRRDSPLIVGVGVGESFIASDVPAILKYTNKYILLGEGQIAQVGKDVLIFDDNLEISNNDVVCFEGDLEVAEKNGYAHFMLKEIHEQPMVINNTISPFLNNGLVSLQENMPDFSKYNCINIVGCGSAYHAGLVGKYLIEKYAFVPVNVCIASEFRYQKFFSDENSLVILISQSGETADTLACLRRAHEMGIDTLAIVNVVGSSLAREADKTIYTKAGCEISVATTKAYLAQITVLSLIALSIGYDRNFINENKALEIIDSYGTLPNLIENMINYDYKAIARALYKKDRCFYIGRGIDYALSMEGSLKLKEISYIVSVAYPAGELKHGTISLIENGSNVIAVITDKNIADKTISNIKEVKSRGACVTLISKKGICSDVADYNVVIDDVNDFICPMVCAIPLQLIGYETAKLRKCDIDKPKNLAKSVTVE